jgi:2-(1,2-epoxy-1,2-dihydrophenyl)acetyl-CoA isomerase
MSVLAWSPWKEASVSLTGTPELRVDLDPETGVLVLELHRPEARNALTLTMLTALADALDAAELNERVRVVALTGAGRGFCAGGDLKVFALGESIFGPVSEPGIRAARQRELQRRTTVRLRELRKPTIALINGAAVGAGLGLSLACDLRYMAADAVLRTGFVNVGLAGDFGCTWLLNSLLGPSRTAELLFFATPLTAEDAMREGLVHEVFPADELMAGGRERAGRLARLSAAALEGIKDNITRAQHSSLADAADAEVSWHVRLLATPEHRAAVDAMNRAIPASGGPS